MGNVKNHKCKRSTGSILDTTLDMNQIEYFLGEEIQNPFKGE